MLRVGPLLLVLGGCAPRFAPVDPGAAAPVDGTFVVVSDGDQAGTAYGFGKLRRVDGVEDALSLVYPDGEVVSIGVSNSVVSWPQVMDLGDGGATAWVVETRGRPPDGVERVGDVFTRLPEGRALTRVDLTGPSVAWSEPVAVNPEHVSVDRSGRWAVANTEVADAQLVFVPLTEDGPGEPQPVALVEQRRLRPEDAAFDGDGDMIAVTVYHDPEPVPVQGWIELWRLRDDRLIRTGRRIAVPRGPHDIELIPPP